MGRKLYKTEEERKEAQRAARKRWNEAHPEEVKEGRRRRQKRYAARNGEKIAERMSEWRDKYRSTQIGRAHQLVDAYKYHDKKAGRGECLITPDWVIENIFTQPCHYCGETDWKLLGCDRIDNTKPHTPDNVVCCCGKCNTKKQKTPYEEYMRMIRKIA